MEIWNISFKKCDKIIHCFPLNCLSLEIDGGPSFFLSDKRTIESKNYCHVHLIPENMSPMNIC